MTSYRSCLGHFFLVRDSNHQLNPHMDLEPALHYSSMEIPFAGQSDDRASVPGNPAGKRLTAGGALSELNRFIYAL